MLASFPIGTTVFLLHTCHPMTTASFMVRLIDESMQTVHGSNFSRTVKRALNVHAAASPRGFVAGRTLDLHAHFSN